MLVILAGAAWYFIPRSVEKADKGQQDIISMQANEIKYWKTSSENWQKAYFALILQQRDELRGIKDTVTQLQTQVSK